MGCLEPGTTSLPQLFLAAEGGCYTRVFRLPHCLSWTTCLLSEREGRREKRMEDGEEEDGEREGLGEGVRQGVREGGKKGGGKMEEESRKDGQ